MTYQEARKCWKLSDEQLMECRHHDKTRDGDIGDVARTGTFEEWLIKTTEERIYCEANDC